MRKLWLVACAAAFGLLLTASTSFAGPTASITSGGTVNVASIGTAQGTAPAGFFDDTPGVSASDPAMHVNGAIKKFHGKPVSVPTPQSQSVAGSTSGWGFNGLSHADQRLADGGNQFSLEPPDQALCVGGGYVLEGVNLAFRVYSIMGAPMTGAVAFNPFFTNDHAIIRTGPLTGLRGWFLSDPKCYYDPDTNRFFMTVLGINPDGYHTAQFIAVTQTGDPTAGWYKYSFDTTDDGTNGTPNNPGCSVGGCLGDQPLIGADKYGFFITTNEFPSGGFNGAQVYATSKTALESGTPGPLVHIVTNGLAEGPAYTVQPATAPDGVYDTSNGGTEYFLSALDFNGTLDGRIAAWSLTNTSSLNTPTPNVRLQSTIVKSESYGQPAPAQQKPGATPLGSLVGGPLETLNSNDDRMNQVVFAGGLLWSGVNTVVQTADGSTRTGIAWFAVSANGKAQGQLDAHIKQQGYVSVNGDNVLFPAIGATAAGKAVMTFTLVGPDYFPSAAWLTLTGGDGMIHVSGAGAGPEDGFTGYAFFGGNGTSRWGDYSAAVPGPNGSVWLATEYIPGGLRTVNANWGTFVTSVTP